MIKKILDAKTVLKFKPEMSDFYINYNEQQLKQMLLSDHHIYGWFDDEKLIGYIIILDLKKEYELINIVVENNFQNKGIGQKLLLYTIENIIFNCKLFLEVNENNRKAISFYKEFGFIEIGRRKKYYHNKQDAILMVLSQE